MREIKFRVWNIEHEQLHPVDSMSFRTNGDIFRVWKSRDKSEAGLLINLSYNILMQYTGIKDINGKEIYEGDIIRKEICSPDDPAYGFYGDIGIVEYEEKTASFVVNDKYKKYLIYGNIVVIGNIYENPELAEDNNG